VGDPPRFGNPAVRNLSGPVVLRPPVARGLPFRKQVVLPFLYGKRRAEIGKVPLNTSKWLKLQGSICLRWRRTTARSASRKSRSGEKTRKPCPKMSGCAQRPGRVWRFLRSFLFMRNNPFAKLRNLAAGPLAGLQNSVLKISKWSFSLMKMTQCRHISRPCVVLSRWGTGV